MNKILISVLILLVSCGEREKFFISSGSPGAIYYPTAKALCKNFNEHDTEYECVVLQSTGANSNISGLQNKKFEFGISQATLQREYNKKSDIKILPVMGLHHEHFSIVVAGSSNINSLDDLKGKRVNIGNPGSGSRVYFSKIMQAKGWVEQDFSEMYDKNSSYLDDLICENKIDAAIYLVGHPNEVFSNIINDCGGRLVNLSKSDKKFLHGALFGFKDTMILPGTYLNQQYEVNTIGIPIILSTHEDVDPKIIERMKRYSMENKIFLENQHVIFKEIDFKL